MIFRVIFKLLITLLALTMIVVGIVVTPTPVPVGLVFILIGFFLLTAAAPDLVRWLRRRWGWLDRKLVQLEKRLPRWLGRILHRSEVDQEEHDKKDKKRKKRRS